MRWSLRDLAGKREPCKLQGRADPLESHIIPWTDGVSVGPWEFPCGMFQGLASSNHGVVSASEMFHCRSAPQVRGPVL